MTTTLLSVAAIVGVVAVVERLFPLRRLRLPWHATLSETLNAVVFLALSAARTALLTSFVLGVLVPFLRRHHLPLPVQPLVSLPLAAQFAVHFVVVDLLDWCVHRLLHAVGPFWTFHRVHHSVRDDEMRGLVSFRFSPGEIALYTLLQGVPLLFLAVDPRVALVVGVVQLAVGVVAHGNVSDSAVARAVARVVVTPGFHRWHHAHDDEGAPANFGHCLTVWDHLFGSARIVDRPPSRLGHSGDEQIVPHVVGHQLFPLLQRSEQQRKPVE